MSRTAPLFGGAATHARAVEKSLEEHRQLTFLARHYNADMNPEECARALGTSIWRVYHLAVVHLDLPWLQPGARPLSERFLIPRRVRKATRRDLYDPR